MDDEVMLAMVIGHELAHVEEGHVVDGIRAGYGMQLLGELAAGAAAGRGVDPGVLAKTYEYAMSAAVNGHGRRQEAEADRLGLEYLAAAGYDPRRAPYAFERLLEEYGDPPPPIAFFYADHPCNAKRFEATRKQAVRLAARATVRTLEIDGGEFLRRTREIVVAVGVLDYEQKRYGAARAMLEKALRAWQEDPVSHDYLGRIALETGGPGAVDRAIAHFEEAIRYDESYAPAYRSLGSAYYRKGEREKAIVAFENYLEIAPDAEDADRIRRSIEELQRYG